ncbi:MAG: tetratricopeptide repeat protein [Planctomycetaceae bacterium]|nr:tetratricopeptide repeat protein [Planctomycetaceae bacterium]
MDRRGRYSYYSHNASPGAAPGGGGGMSILLGFLLGVGAIVIGAICICILYFGYTYADRLENLESGIRAVAAAERAPAPTPDISAAEAAKAAAAGVGESIARILEAQRDAALRNAPAPVQAAPAPAPSPQIYLMMGGQGPNGGLHYNNAPAAFQPQGFPAAVPGSPQAEINQFVASKYQAEFSEYLRQRALQNANANGMFHTGSPYAVPGLSPISMERQYINADIPVPKKMTIDLKRRFSRDETVEQWFRDEAAADLDFDPDAVTDDGLAPPETNDPQLDMVLRGLAESTFYDKQYERSARVYAELAARSVNLSVVELNRWAKASELAGDTESAVRILELVVKIDPDNLDILKEIAQLQVVGGNFSAAAETYLRLMNREPGNREWRMWRAKTLTWSDRGREAVELMRDLYREDPTDMELNLMLADLLLSLHEFEESLPLLDSLIAHKPDDDTLRVRKMNALMALQRFMDAAEIGADLLTRYPEDSGLLLKQAKNYLAAGEYQLAIEPYSLYLALKPDDIEVRKEYAENLMAAQEFSIAAGEYQEILEVEPDNNDIHKKLANAYMAANDFRSAAIEYESLVAVFPDDEEVNLGLVTSLRMSGQDAAALQAAKNYLRRDPFNQKVLVQAAGLAMAAGDTEHGLAWYRTAIRLDPTDFESRIELGNALIGAAKYDVAEHEFRRALVFDDGNMKARRGLARSLYYQRKYTESFDVYKRMTWEVMDEGLLLEYKYRQAVANGKEIEASNILT